jgi:hypothetical protein
VNVEGVKDAQNIQFILNTGHPLTPPTVHRVSCTQLIFYWVPIDTFIASRPEICSDVCPRNTASKKHCSVCVWLSHLVNLPPFPPFPPNEPRPPRSTQAHGRTPLGTRTTRSAGGMNGAQSKGQGSYRVIVHEHGEICGTEEAEAAFSGKGVQEVARWTCEPTSVCRYPRRMGYPIQTPTPNPNAEDETPSSRSILDTVGVRLHKASRHDSGRGERHQTGSLYSDLDLCVRLQVHVCVRNSGGDGVELMKIDNAAALRRLRHAWCEETVAKRNVVDSVRMPCLDCVTERARARARVCVCVW